MRSVSSARVCVSGPDGVWRQESTHHTINSAACQTLPGQPCPRARAQYGHCRRIYLIAHVSRVSWRVDGARPVTNRERSFQTRSARRRSGNICSCQRNERALRGLRQAPYPLVKTFSNDVFPQAPSPLVRASVKCPIVRSTQPTAAPASAGPSWSLRSTQAWRTCRMRAKRGGSR